MVHKSSTAFFNPQYIPYAVSKQTSIFGVLSYRHLESNPFFARNVVNEREQNIKIQYYLQQRCLFMFESDY